MRAGRYYEAVTTILCMLVLVGPTNIFAGSMDISKEVRKRTAMRSFKDLRDRNLVRQTFDYSCGAGALATLLTYGLGDPVSEREVLSAVLDRLSEDEESLRRKEGISVLDMQLFAQSRGYRARGFRLAAASLSALKGPVIVFIKPRGYAHFAVLKGIRDDRVYLADPSLGNQRMSLRRFIDMWLDESGTGVIFVAERVDGSPFQQNILSPPTSGAVRPELYTVRQRLYGSRGFFTSAQPWR